MVAFFTVLDKLITLFIYLLVGYIIRKKNIIDDNFTSGLVKLLMNVCLPFLNINTFQADYTPEMLTKGASIFVVGLCVYAGSFIIGWLTSTAFKADRSIKGIWIFMTIFSNNLFMGFPVVEALFGKEALFYAALLNIPNAILIFTVGIYIISKYGGKEGEKLSLRKRFVTPINIAMVIGLIFFVTGIKLPSSVAAATSGISSITTPLAMMYIGIIMSKNKISEAFNDKKVYIISFFRLIVIPLLIFFIAGRFVSDMAVLGVLVISFAMPVSGNGATFVGQYGGDVGFASRLTFVSTLLSLITMPFISLLLI